MGTYLFFQIFLTYHSSSFVQRVGRKTHFQKNIYFWKRVTHGDDSRPREHARKEGFKSFPSDASSICHKTSSKLSLVIGGLHLVHCFKVCFKHVRPLPTESGVN